MFSIRRIYDDLLPVNKSAIESVRKIFVEQFSGAPIEDLDGLAQKLRNPFDDGFRPILYVAEKAKKGVVGFAIALHDPKLQFMYLDYIAAGKLIAGRGVGAALYEHIREEAVAMQCLGVFFECLPDDPEKCADPAICKGNAARLKFYETYRAYPIINTKYESPVPDGSSDNLPFLVFDGLDRKSPLPAAKAKKIVRAVLERKYAHLCPPEYVRMVVASFRDEPVQLRSPRYGKPAELRGPIIPSVNRIALVLNDKHDIHHVRERGYVESPIRISTILRELESGGLIEKIDVRKFSDRHLEHIHSTDLIEYLRKACAATPEGKSVYPYVFPNRKATRPPSDWSVRAGYYCIDTFTPINRNAWHAARRGVDCSLTAADEMLNGRHVAYALVRPPGHHAERKTFGGFCYFNNAAIAAHYLSTHGKVALLDIDYHHGNGQQDIFYERDDVLTVSIHGDPDFAYPYFTGFADEIGVGTGKGFNFNLPMPEKADGKKYRTYLNTALDRIRRFEPTFLLISLGFDLAKGDPTGTFSLVGADFRENGRMIAGLNLPTLVVQEGGYKTRTLGTNARQFFQGMLD